MDNTANLRFEIFKQAYNILSDQYSSEYQIADNWNDNPDNTVKIDYPEFPSLNEVLEKAEVIASFVNS